MLRGTWHKHEDRYEQIRYHSHNNRIRTKVNIRAANVAKQDTRVEAYLNVGVQLTSYARNSNK